MRKKEEIIEEYNLEIDNKNISTNEYLFLEVLIDIRDELERLNDVSLPNIRGDIRGER